MALTNGGNVFAGPKISQKAWFIGFESAISADIGGGLSDEER
jgi:hypothetical protein